MWRYVKLFSPGIVLASSGCLPDNYFPSLIGGSINSVVGVLLSDALNVLIPPI